MLDHLNIGPCPTDEDCAQMGRADYDLRSRAECAIFAAQLRRQFGEEPANARVVVKSFSHDFGYYREVCVRYSDQDEEAIAYAYRVENGHPAYWDAASLKALDDAGYPANLLIGPRP